MLSARATKRHHQVFESSALVVAHASIHHRQRTCEKLMDSLLLVQVVNDRCIFAGETLEALFSPGIWKTTTIENESAAVTGWVLGKATVKGKTRDAYGHILCRRRLGLELFGGHHVAEGFHQRRKGDRQFHVVNQPADVFQGIRNALQEVCLALIESAKAVCAQGLHDANV